jgi:very-short-patch-repair endonuclease
MDYIIQSFTHEECDIKEFLEEIDQYSDLVKKLIWDELYRSFELTDSYLMEIKSPIEQALFLAIRNSGCLAFLERYAKDVHGGESLILDYQHQIKTGNKTYYADLALCIWLKNDSTVNLAIECDGHEFHEKTKKQAQYDRQRERAITAAGYTVIRFTGSEIFKDPYKCADEIRDLAFSQIKKNLGIGV